MLDDLRRFFSDLIDEKKPQDQFAENDYRRAAAALLVHIATLDGELTDAKRSKLHAILEREFALDAAATDELIAEAAADDREAVDFYHFTSLLMRTLDEAGRLNVVEMLWEMVYADGKVTEFEANVMWRVADLLAVSTRDRVMLRERVAAAAEAGDAGEGAT
ncbi:MAG TPA: TerB family tellurite resistance protein [Xanthobacteraceae bacterium]|jgi:uncharacterized tellurite resistance protein B-like protein|nr:TerB family tellurite resistance protein [Xanthobacteraceae bacterium]